MPDKATTINTNNINDDKCTDLKIQFSKCLYEYDGNIEYCKYIRYDYEKCLKKYH